MSSVPEHLRGLEGPAPRGDKLDDLRKHVALARDIEMSISDLEEQLADKRRRLQELYSKTLPDMMDAAGVAHIAIPAEGNYPGFDAKVAPFYAAGVPVSWPAEKRVAAFAWLQNNGHGDLIKTEVQLKFQRDQRAEAIKVATALEAQGLHPEVKESVHSGTLTAWLREQVEGGNPLPPLDIIGGTVGRTVRLKALKK